MYIFVALVSRIHATIYHTKSIHPSFNHTRLFFNIMSILSHFMLFYVILSHNQVCKSLWPIRSILSLWSFLGILNHSRSLYIILSYIKSLKSIRSLLPFSCIHTFPEEVLSVLCQTCQFILKQAQDRAKHADGWAGSVVQHNRTTVQQYLILTHLIQAFYTLNLAGYTS